MGTYEEKKYPIDASGWLFELFLLADISRWLWGSRVANKFVNHQGPSELWPDKVTIINGAGKGREERAPYK